MTWCRAIRRCLSRRDQRGYRYRQPINSASPRCARRTVYWLWVRAGAGGAGCAVNCPGAGQLVWAGAFVGGFGQAGGEPCAADGVGTRSQAGSCAADGAGARSQAGSCAADGVGARSQAESCGAEAKGCPGAAARAIAGFGLCFGFGFTGASATAGLGAGAAASALSAACCSGGG